MAKVTTSADISDIASAIVRENIRRLFEHAERSKVTQVALGKAADELFPGRGADQWRKAFRRALESGDPPVGVAMALAGVFGVRLEQLYAVDGIPDKLVFEERPSVDDVVEVDASNEVDSGWSMR